MQRLHEFMRIVCASSAAALRRAVGALARLAQEGEQAMLQRQRADGDVEANPALILYPYCMLIDATFYHSYTV